jgi:alkylation response protein AidB-like acyl-CoA dehydrogenase
MADFGAQDNAAFRAEARAWLEANFPPSLKNRHDIAASEAPVPVEGDYAIWKTRMGDKGWGVPTWPAAYGGGGLSAADARILREEMARLGAWNPIGGMGVMMFGPTLLEYGTETQKQRHIPPIVRGELRWCQGYSEPGAGSDLASLQTRAEDKGDHFLVNGQKIWTSGAQYADWCFCLVRTDTTKKHEGISFVLFTMHQPGVEVRPIKLIAGNSPFCETFFTDVKIPKENLVGQVNGGWQIAKRLLQYERQNISGGFGPGEAAGGTSSDLGVMARNYVGTDEDGALADPDLRTRITRNKMDFDCFYKTIRRIEAESKASNGPSAATSIIKYAVASFAQERSELIVEMMGSQGLGWTGDDFAPQEIGAVRGWLRAKANSIEGGSSEVNLNVISKRVLGLPDPA